MTKNQSETSGLIKPKEGQKNCLYTHVKEAIELNEQRAAQYRELTEGKSSSISRRLIVFEKLSIPFVARYDNRAAEFQSMGINVLCDDLIDMKNTPQYQAQWDDLSKQQYLFLDTDEIKDKIDALIAGQKFLELFKYANSQVEYIEEQHGTNCMLKHFLESIRRSAYIITMRKFTDNALRERVEEFTQDYLEYQARYLKQADELDALAVDLHKQGVGIICRDVPHIPYRDLLGPKQG